MNTVKPKHIPEKEWKYAVERAERARRYAEHFGFQTDITVTTNPEVRFQDPAWQWENEVRGRFSGVVGGNLKP